MRLRKKGTKEKSIYLAAAFCMALALGGCGNAYSNDSAGADSSYSTSSATMDSYDYMTAVPEEGLYMNEAKADYDTAADSAATVQPDTTASERKLIKTVNLTVETKEFDSLQANVEKRVTELGGYVEDLYSYNGSAYSGYKSSRSASMTIRIPKDVLEEFLGEVAELSNVVSRSESVQDVTLEYVDMESHKKTLLTEQDRLLELLEQAESIDDIITIESRLSNVQYQIESMESQLRTYDNKVDYSTVYLDIQEVKDLTPVVTEEPTTWERISEGFVSSLKNVGNGFKEFFIWFVVHIPYLIIWAVVIILIVVVWRALHRHRRAKKEAKNAAKNAVQNAQQPPVQEQK